MLPVDGYYLWFSIRINGIKKTGIRNKRMEDILSTALSFITTMGLMPYIQAFILVAIAVGFLQMLFRKN